MKIHTLVNGSTVGHLSPHGFKFSDGTECEGQDSNLVSQFTLARKSEKVKEINGMAVNSTAMILSEDQVDGLKNLGSMVDVLIVPFPVLSAMREQGLRDEVGLDNLVAFNATEETRRSAPTDKVVDVNNWSF